MSEIGFYLWLFLNLRETITSCDSQILMTRGIARKAKITE